MNTKTDIKKHTSIEYHADDFGLFLTQSKRILDCHINGILNGISVMPNSDSVEECMNLLIPYENDIAVTVHLNIIEGRSLSPVEEVPLLTDKNGVFSVSFGKLLISSFLPSRKNYRQQLKRELRAQINAVKMFLPVDAQIRLDGHAHYHMLPVVFDALMDVIQEDCLKVSYIRIPREYPALYLKHWKCLRYSSPINLLKVLILNVLANRNERKYRETLNQFDKKIFMGVFLSGRMYQECVLPILPDAEELAKKKNWGVEVLAHPGGVFEEEDITKLTNPDDVAFLTSDSRRKEALLFLSRRKVHEQSA